MAEMKIFHENKRVESSTLYCITDNKKTIISENIRFTHTHVSVRKGRKKRIFISDHKHSLK